MRDLRTIAYDSFTSEEKAESDWRRNVILSMRVVFKEHYLLACIEKDYDRMLGCYNRLIASFAELRGEDGAVFYTNKFLFNIGSTKNMWMYGSRK